MDPAELKRIDRVALACIQCRGRHVKCDATQPVCNRCKRDGKECNYQKSRRGGLDKAALARRRIRLQQEAERAVEDPQGNLEPDNANQSSTDSSPMGDQSLLEQYASIPGFDAIQIIDSDFCQSNVMGFQINADRLLDFFYENFFPSFPITLPLHYLNRRKMSSNHGMENLIPVMQWIGSIFAPWAPSDPYYQTAFQALSLSTFPRTPFNVQALLLFATAQHHYDLKPESRKTLDMAVGLALELRMNEKAFAQAYGEGNPVLEESWRRTYYFLHIVDQHFAIVTNSPVFLMQDVPNLVDLPCDDELYERAQIPPIVAWKDYQNREFEDVEVIYSSIAYLWDIQTIAAYIMKYVVQTGSFDDTMIAAVDAKIAAWQSLLPACKKDPMGPNGKVDEVMFMAHMSAAVVMMTIHRPFSSLSYSVEELSTESFSVPVPFIEPGKAGRSTHTARALKAAEMQTKLLAIPCSVEKHNVFTMCISAELATAQISACNTLLEDHALSIARDRVRLSIGFLKTMGSIWPLAKRMAKDVRMVARATLAGAQSTESIQVDPAAAIEIPRDEIIWPIDASAQIDIYSGIVLPTTWDASMGYTSSSGSSNT